MLFKILGGVNNYVTSVTFTYFMLFLKFHRSILVTHNGKSPPLLLAHAKIVVFINNIKMKLNTPVIVHLWSVNILSQN